MVSKHLKIAKLSESRFWQTKVWDLRLTELRSFTWVKLGRIGIGVGVELRELGYWFSPGGEIDFSGELCCVHCVKLNSSIYTVYMEHFLVMVIYRIFCPTKLVYCMAELNEWCMIHTLRVMIVVTWWMMHFMSCMPFKIWWISTVNNFRYHHNIDTFIHTGCPPKLEPLDLC